VVTGLEHDEWGHPSGNPLNHEKMTAKRRDKLIDLAKSLPTPEVHGETSGSLLFVGWGSTYGPIKEATDRMISEGHKVGSINLRHIHPLPSGLNDLFDQYDHILVPEMNDSGLYGYGQLATLLRAKTCNGKIESVNKVQGISFRVLEIVTAAEALIAKA
jgi:2-oxoglutarate ferredoxin oxidoreductase subunit alpha